MDPLLVSLLMIVGGLVALYFGAEWLVRGASSIAVRLGLTPLVIGLTVVAWGTSTPELVVSVKAAWQGQGDISVGNVVGSNIFNIGVILGLAAVIHPMKAQFQLIRFDTPIMVGVAAAFLVLFRDQALSRIEGTLLIGSLIAYTIINLRLARQAALTPEVQAEFDEVAPRTPNALGVDAALIVGGLAVLVLGSRLLVDGATSIARAWGVSEAIIGLTIVAAGTSMPELATSVVAAMKKQSDIALGNIVGSNIYNILAILGASAFAAPLRATGVQMTDVYVMIAFSVLLLPIIRSGFSIQRWEGFLLLAGYAAYLWHLWPSGA